VAIEVHLFRAQGFKLAFFPRSDALLRVDEVGWDLLKMAGEGLPQDAIRRRLRASHGARAATRGLEEFAALSGALGGSDPDPLTTQPAPGDWLPSEPAAPRLKSLCLNVAHDCDLACRYCFAGQGGFGGGRGLMDAGVARAAVDLLVELSGDTGAVEIDFFGGEPLLNLEVVRETVDYARRRERSAGKTFSFTLTTNAATLGPEEAAYLNETMNNVVLSLDGRPEVHDRMRPFAGGGDRPSQAVILDRVKSFVALRADPASRRAPDYWVRGTYTALNLDFADDVAYLAGQGLRNVSLEPVVGGPVGPGGYGLAPSHLAAIGAEYLRLATFLDAERRAGRPVTFFHFIAEPDAAPCYAKRVRGCGAGREYAAVTPDGALYPCHQFVGREGFRMGDVRAGLAPEAGAVEVAGQWLGSKPGCLDCWVRYRCSGGCHANAHAATGTVRRPDPLGCALLKTRLEASLYLQALSET